MVVYHSLHCLSDHHLPSSFAPPLRIDSLAYSSPFPAKPVLKDFPTLSSIAYILCWYQSKPGGSQSRRYSERSAVQKENISPCSTVPLGSNPLKMVKVAKKSPSSSSLSARLEGPADLNPHDVICGRGSSNLIKVLSGNMAYRKLIERNLDQYESAAATNKRPVSQSIVDQVLKRGGRFLEFDTKTMTWYDVGYERAVTKTAQAFRDRRNAPSTSTSSIAKKSSTSTTTTSSATVTPKRTTTTPIADQEKDHGDEEDDSDSVPSANSGNDDDTTSLQTFNSSKEDDSTSPVRQYTSALIFPLISPRDSCDEFDSESPSSTRSSSVHSASPMAGDASTTTATDRDDPLMESEEQKRSKSNDDEELAESDAGPPTMEYNFDYFYTTTPEHALPAARVSPVNDSGTDSSSKREMFWYWKLK